MLFQRFWKFVHAFHAFRYSCICIFHLILFEMKSVLNVTDKSFVQSPSKFAFKSTTQTHFKMKSSNVDDLKFHLSKPPNPISPLLTSQNSSDYSFIVVAAVVFFSWWFIGNDFRPLSLCFVLYESLFVYFFLSHRHRQRTCCKVSAQTDSVRTQRQQKPNRDAVCSPVFLFLLLLHSGQIHLWRHEIDKAVKSSGGLQVQ